VLGGANGREFEAAWVTATHPMWSVDRGGWAAVDDLGIGERVLGKDGPTAVQSVNRRQTTEPVFKH